MVDSPTPLPDVFCLTLEDLTDEAETRDGVLDREAVDVLYLRRGIEPGQAIAIERALKSAGIVIREDESESPPPPAKAPGPSATALDYLLWCARGYRLLSHDEEAAYGEAVQRARLVGGKPASERSDLESRLLEAGARARTRLVLSNIRLVAKFANDPSVRGRLDMDDLVQVGLLGLIRAADRYDPAFETRFSTYAVWWIRRFISRTIDDEGRTIRLPVHVHERVRKFRRARRVLESDGASRRPDISRVADALGWTTTETARVASLAEMRVVSLDDRMDPRGETTYAERMEADSPSPESVYEVFERDERLRRLVEGLGNRRLQDIVVRRFGLDGDDALTLQELGERYGVTRERIRQLEAKALRNLRQRAYAGEFLPSQVPGR